MKYLYYWLIGFSEPRIVTLDCDMPTAIIKLNRYYTNRNVRIVVLYDSNYNVIMKRGIK